MRVSKSFLNDYVDLSNINYNELANKMVFAGNEYDKIEKISTATNLVIGKIIECSKHPNSNKLSICKVDIGDNEVKQILCGAPNVEVNQKVIVAKVGAELPNGMIIGKAKLAGMESEGMICSLAELGIESKYLTEMDKKGIHVLNEDAPIGMDAIKYMGYDDEVIDFDLTADRNDLLSMLGMAYEVGALYNKEVTYPVMDYTELKEDINENYGLKVETENCFLYLAKLVKNVAIKKSPYFIQTRLMASGIRPINNVVDISNYVMLETGQPLHFFDADKINKNIIVRMANEEEKIKTLDEKERLLKKDDIVIADDNHPLALAGVMGGLDSEITENTKNIIIESAIFNPLNIRYTSKRILRSESSMRFEKGVDPNRTLLALKRACYLLSIHADGEIAQNLLNYDITDKNDKHIKITINKINSILGMNLSQEQIFEVFDKLKFNYVIDGNEFNVFIPTRRMDVNIEEDLIEEVGRIIGYNNIKGVLPKSTIKEGSYLPKTIMIKKIMSRLQSLGLNQVMTYSLINKKESDKFINIDYEKISLLDPMSEDKKIMRNSIIPSLLEVYNYNSARDIKDINLFEVGSCYYKGNDLYHEEVKVSGLMSGDYLFNKWLNKTIEVDFYVLKGVIENLLNYLGFNNYKLKTDNLADMHPNRSCIITINDETIGYFGQVHPLINKDEIYVFELSIDKLFSINTNNIVIKDVPKYPAINKDVAFVVSKETLSLDIVDVIKKVGGNLLTNIEVFDVYEGPNIGNDEKSIAYSLTFQDPSQTLKDEEINILFNKIIEAVKEKGARVRDK